MATAYYQFQPTPVTPSMNMSHNPTSHHARHRRAPRLSVSQNTQHKQFRGVRSMKELAEATTVAPTTPVLSSFRDKFEAVRSFDLEDDLEFIPSMLTETDLVSISSVSEMSSVASLSPDASPLQHPAAPTFTLNSSSATFVSQVSQASLPLQQPAVTRVRNAIPIINPLDGSTMPSPPPIRNISPGRLMLQQQQPLQQAMARRW